MIELAGARVARTRIDPKTNNPKWGEKFVIACAHDVDSVIVRVKDKDAVGSKTMGMVRLFDFYIRALLALSVQSLRAYCHRRKSCLREGQGRRCLQDPGHVVLLRPS